MVVERRSTAGSETGASPWLDSFASAPTPSLLLLLLLLLEDATGVLDKGLPVSSSS